MSQRDNQVLLRDILEYGEISLALSAGRCRADLDSDAGLRLALERALEIIGEAANHLDPEFCAQHAEIPWRLLVGMRNRLVHGYADVDSDITWATVEDDIGPLLAVVRRLIAQGM